MSRRCAGVVGVALACAAEKSVDILLAPEVDHPVEVLQVGEVSGEKTFYLVGGDQSDGSERLDDPHQHQDGEAGVVRSGDGWVPQRLELVRALSRGA